MVIRPYYWFEEDVSKPVRITRQFSEEQIVSINDSYDKIVDVIALADQISGVAFRKKYMNFQFKNGYFMEMPSMVASMLKNHKTVILKDNIVAVRIGASGALNPIVYKKSPLMSWYNLITTTYSGKKFSGLKKHLIHNFIAKNYIGLVQIKNFGSYTALFKEIVYMVKLRWKNILTFQFWIFSVGTMIIPRFILRKLVVFYKNKINSTLLKNIKPIKIV